jgi:cell division protein FtsI (penicillin-binding protein 3)
MIYKSLETDSSPPKPTVLTLDRNIQYFAEEILAQGQAQFSAKAGIIAVQDPFTGEILAMASHPTNSLKNPVVQDTFEPGSTFKIVAAAAALEEGTISEKEGFFCENGSYELAPGVIIHDHEPSGTLNLAGILEHSSNIGMAKIAERLGPIHFYRTSRLMGFANKTGISLPGETGGEMKPLSDMGRVALAAASYGYGIGTSPLQILNAYNALANGGTLWEPQIVKDGRRPTKVRRIASPKTVATLSRILEGIIERGTGVSAQVPGWRVAGKTGTSRKFDAQTGRYSSTDYNASFVGFLPASRPLWTILVILENPRGQYYGAQVAAPLFARLARRLVALKGIAPDGRPPTRLALRASPTEGKALP